MDLRLLRYFVAVIEHGTVAKAADILRIPRDSLYVHLGLLKDTFGTPLIVTKMHQVTPTPAGRIVLEGARDLIERLDAINDAVTKLKNMPLTPR